jgi:hypothetical protein
VSSDYIKKVPDRNVYQPDANDPSLTRLVITRNDGSQYTVMLDTGDVAKVRRHVWRVQPYFHGQYVYPCTGTAGAMFSVGQYLLGLGPADPDNRCAAYRDRDGMNCRRSNLLIASRSEIKRKAKLPPNTSSGEPNIFRFPNGKRFRVNIQHRGHLYVSTHTSLGEAVAARDAMKAKLFPDAA